MRVIRELTFIFFLGCSTYFFYFLAVSLHPPTAVPTIVVINGLPYYQNTTFAPDFAASPWFPFLASGLLAMISGFACMASSPRAIRICGFCGINLSKPYLRLYLTTPGIHRSIKWNLGTHVMRFCNQSHLKEYLKAKSVEDWGQVVK